LKTFGKATHRQERRVSVNETTRSITQNFSGAYDLEMEKVTLLLPHLFTHPNFFSDISNHI
jgi:hypothetical protein